MKQCRQIRTVRIQRPHTHACSNIRKGPFKCYVTLFFWKLDPHPPLRNANNIEHYTFVMLFSRKSDTPHPHLRYITLEWPLRAIQVLHNVEGGGEWGVGFPGGGGKCYEGVQFNAISVTRGWVGGYQFSRKKRYITFE